MSFARAISRNLRNVPVASTSSKAAATGTATATMGVRNKHTLPELPYGYGALEPYISGQIMETHHSKHHQTYVNGLNAALEQVDAAQAAGDAKKQISIQAAVRFNGGGHINHSLFWENLAPKNQGGGEVADSSLLQAIKSEYGSVDNLKQKMNAASAGIQGSGWTWLAVDPEKKNLSIVTMPNQDPLTSHIPILGIDMWEHAYYLQYKNVKPDYLKNIWEVVNWDTAWKRYKKAVEA